VNGDLVDVHLLDLPVATHDHATSHMNALQRELELIRRRDPDLTSVPHRLQTLVDELTQEYGGVGDQPSEQLAEAIERGEVTIRLLYRVPRSAGEASQRLASLLDEVDDYCRSGDLLTLVTPSEIARYRRWFLGEFANQTAGKPALPWPAYRDTPPAVAPAAGPPTTSDLRVPTTWLIEDSEQAVSMRVHGPLDLVSAPALRDALSSLIADRPRVVIDLSGCDFLDSVGVSVLVAALLRADERQVSLAFRLSDAVERVIRLSGLEDRLDLER
jgi:anti-sigma B factor antagonist